VTGEQVPEVRRAVVPLIALAVEVRPDWRRADVQGAIIAAANAGWEWPRVLVEVARLLTDVGAVPRDLIEASLPPTAVRPAPEPGTEARGAELVRAALRGEEVL
jgi:hypothetical protein